VNEGRAEGEGGKEVGRWKINEGMTGKLEIQYLQGQWPRYTCRDGEIRDGDNNYRRERRI